MTEDICRMCLQKGTASNFININFGQPSIKTKIHNLIPELNLDLIQDPVICGPCSASLESFYQLKIKCLRSEERIWAHLNQAPVSMKSVPIKLINLLPHSDFPSVQEEIMVEPNFNYYQQNYEERSYVTLESSGPPTRSAEPTKSQQNKVTDVLTCTTCKQSFLTREELHAHIPKHLGTRPYMCTYCYKCFSLKSNLQIHLRTHTQDRPFHCDYCQKSFTTKGNLKTHVRVHTKEKPYVCEICDKAFIQKVQLNTHKLLHENDQVFACNICDKSFSSKSTLQVHKRIHEDVKPYICEYCNKAFTTNGNLVVHLRKHTGEKPYNCTHCSKSYSQLGQLRIHQKSHVNQNECKSGMKFQQTEISIGRGES